MLRALPGDRALLPPSPHGLKVLSGPVEPNEPPQDLTPASRRQDHTTSPSASSAVVLHAAQRSRRAIRPALRFARLTLPASTASRPASVTIAIRPLCGTRRRIYRSDLGRRGTDKFFAMGIDSRAHTKSSPSGSHFFTRRHPPSRRETKMGPVGQITCRRSPDGAQRNPGSRCETEAPDCVIR